MDRGRETGRLFNDEAAAVAAGAQSPGTGYVGNRTLLVQKSDSDQFGMGLDVLAYQEEGSFEVTGFEQEEQPRRVLVAGAIVKRHGQVGPLDPHVGINAVLREEQGTGQIAGETTEQTKRNALKYLTI